MTGIEALRIRIRGVVQGVGFRPHVYRLAKSRALTGWVLNGEQGVEIHLEGERAQLNAFVRELETTPPPAAHITAVDAASADPEGFSEFTIRESHRGDTLTVRISPDLPVCADCLKELFDPSDPRFGYPYINCTACGPRYSIVTELPYDRPNTTMKDFPMDTLCAGQYHDPNDRRFHAQPVSCPNCGPHYILEAAEGVQSGDGAAIVACARLLQQGKIAAIKGLGGYHLACDASNAAAVSALRERKFRKEKPFAVMTPDLETARRIVNLSPESEALLSSSARPIVLAPALREFDGVAPGNSELGVMLPYTPLHHLLFAAGAPEILVMTSANRSSEPIAYRDDDARERLSGIADAFLIGERWIARRVEDSVARAGAFGPVILRRSRGYAPEAVAQLPGQRPILAAGADLKNTITLVAAGQAFVSQHIGDLSDYPSFLAHQETIRDLMSMYEIDWDDVLVAGDLHPDYVSSKHAATLPAAEHRSIQHHRAHVASVMAEREAWEEAVLGISLDGTGYGGGREIWGAEMFRGSVAGGLKRIGHLRYAALPGGDAAARYPAQAAAGFLAQFDKLPDLQLGKRFEDSLKLARSGVRTFPTTSMGRLFDTAAALLGFTRGVTFEGQAAIWLEQLARSAPGGDAYPFPFDGRELDFRPLLLAVIEDRQRGRHPAEIARAFHSGIAQGLCRAIEELSEGEIVALSGGVFQNELLLQMIKELAAPLGVRIWINHAVPPNDGGISLGQAALAAFGQFDEPGH